MSEADETIEIKKSELEKLIERKVEKRISSRNSQENSKENSSDMTRRQFLKKAGLGTAGLAALMSPVSALDIKSDEFSVSTGSDSDSLSENLLVRGDGNIEIPNGNLDINSNSIRGVDDIEANTVNGEDADDLGSGADEETVLAYQFIGL